MKSVIVGIVLLFSLLSAAQGQASKELTQQKRTQLEYLLKQIAALYSYAEVAAKGYAIAEQGLTAIKNVKQGDFSLHDQYFASLKTVNPRIKAYWKVAATIALRVQMGTQCREQKRFLQKSNILTTSQKSYTASVLKNVLAGCNALLEDLSKVITDDSLQLKDDERLKRLDRIYSAMQERDLFLRHFCTGLHILEAQARHDEADVKTLRSLYFSH